MLRVKHEVRLWTADAVRELLREALAIVADLEPEPELREAVLTNACGLLAQKQVEFEQVAVGVPAGVMLGNGPGGP